MTDDTTKKSGSEQTRDAMLDGIRESRSGDATPAGKADIRDAIRADVRGKTVMGEAMKKAAGVPVMPVNPNRERDLEQMRRRERRWEMKHPPIHVDDVYRIPGVDATQRGRRAPFPAGDRYFVAARYDHGRDQNTKRVRPTQAYVTEVDTWAGKGPDGQTHSLPDPRAHEPPRWVEARGSTLLIGSQPAERVGNLDALREAFRAGFSPGVTGQLFSAHAGRELLDGGHNEALIEAIRNVSAAAEHDANREGGEAVSGAAGKESGPAAAREDRGSDRDSGPEMDMG